MCLPWWRVVALLLVVGRWRLEMLLLRWIASWGCYASELVSSIDLYSASSNLRG